jgi:hypothetical protein
MWCCKSVSGFAHAIYPERPVPMMILRVNDCGADFAAHLFSATPGQSSADCLLVLEADSYRFYKFV